MFISDIHSNLHALEEVLAYSKTLGIDEIICCGDIVGYNAFPRECVDIIRKNDIACVLSRFGLLTKIKVTVIFLFHSTHLNGNYK